MNTYTAGNYDFVSDSGTTLSASSFLITITTPSIYTNFIYQLNPSSSLSLQVNTNAESYLNLLENSYIEISPTLTCSSLSSTTIVYSISNYNGVTAPNWVAIDSSSRLLKISTPNVTNSTSCSFYINSQISSVTNPVQKLINLKVTKWLAQNCQKWTSLDSSKCSSWNSNYYLSNRYWSNEATSTIKTLSTMDLLFINWIHPPASVYRLTQMLNLIWIYLKTRI